MSEIDKAFGDWRDLVAEMRAYIGALHQRVTELTNELVEELEKQDKSVQTTLRIAQIHLRNTQVALRGGKPDAQEAEQ